MANGDKSIAIGADDAGFRLKEELKKFLLTKGRQVEDYGASDEKPSMYPEIAMAVARAIAAGRHERGILICGTGLGMAIMANKVPGIRAATCHDAYSAERARKSNDAQILTMGARVIGVELAKLIVESWLRSEFEGGGSAAKVEQIKQYEKEILRSGRGDAANRE